MGKVAMKTIAVIPTYDEKDNVRPMAEAVLNCGADGVEILFVDDNSPDGTGKILDEMASADPRIHVLHRMRKEGLGRAYVAGFAEAIRLGADNVLHMDCDFSHNPKDIPRLIASPADLAIGSRYVKGGRTEGWPLKRKLISKAGGIFIRLVTGMRICDPTGGFKRWKKSALEKVNYTGAQSAGYSFMLEMNHRAWRAGLSIEEVPIVFSERRTGYSKITFGIAVESFKMALRLRRGRM